MAEDNNCRHTVMDRINETTWECPKCGAISILRKNISKVQKFRVSGIEMRPGLEVRRLSRSSAYVGVPRQWIGREVVVILVDSSPKIEIPLEEIDIGEEVDIATRINVLMRKNTSQSLKQLSQELKQPQRLVKKGCTILIGLGKLRRKDKNYLYINKLSKS